MSVTAIVKPKGFFSKKLTLKDILPEGFGYGVIDDYYRLSCDECGDYTVIYEYAHPARGIEVSFNDKEVHFRLSLPNCQREISWFYMIVEATCKKLHTKTFYRDGESAELSKIEQYIQYDIAASKEALKSTEDMIKSDEYESLITFGVMNPIYLGLKEIEQIGGDLNKFGEFLEEKQIDSYYAVLHFFAKNDGSNFGVYMIACETRSIVPVKPYVPIGQNLEVNDWYVCLQGPPDNKFINVKYDDFIAYLTNAEYYDSKHVTITLSADDIQELYRLYNTEI